MSSEKETLEEHYRHCGCGERAEKEFNLSEKINLGGCESEYCETNINVSDIKEFLKRLKGKCVEFTHGTMEINYQDLMIEIDKLAGDKLIVK